MPAENTPFISFSAVPMGMPDSNGPLRGTRDKLKNAPREKGISPPQGRITSFEVGDTVHLRIDPSIPEGRFPPQFNGLTGTVVGSQGTSYQVEIEDGTKTKTILAAPAHLERQE